MVQQYDVSAAVASRLSRAYGGRAHAVLRIAAEQSAQQLDGRHRLLLPGFPILEAEVAFAVRHDWAVRPEDFLARRTRLAFTNKDAALTAIPRVVELMASELGWSREQRKEETKRCVEYMRHFGGPKPVSSALSSVRMATADDLKDVFQKVCGGATGGLSRQGLQLAGEMLNCPLSEEQVSDCWLGEEGGEVSLAAFAEWWNSERLNPGLAELKISKADQAGQEKGSNALFG